MICDEKHIKYIHCYQVIRFGNLHDVARFEAFLQTIQNKMPEKLVRNNVKMEFEILWSQMRSEELFVILCTAFQPLALLRLLLIS